MLENTLGVSATDSNTEEEEEAPNVVELLQSLKFFWFFKRNIFTTFKQ